MLQEKCDVIHNHNKCRCSFNAVADVDGVKMCGVHLAHVAAGLKTASNKPNKITILEVDNRDNIKQMLISSGYQDSFSSDKC